MKIGILGSGQVGIALANKLLELGHTVGIGSRTAGNEKTNQWKVEKGENSFNGSFDEVSKDSEIIISALKGDAVIDAFKSIKQPSLMGKTIIEISNPLDFTNGFPPFLIPAYSNITSLAEEIQKLFPESFVIKTLNTVNFNTMINPNQFGTDSPTMFVAGENENSIQITKEILESFGWNDILVMNQLSASRGLEMMVINWVNMYKATGNIGVALKVLR